MLFTGKESTETRDAIVKSSAMEPHSNPRGLKSVNLTTIPFMYISSYIVVEFAIGYM